MKRMIGLLMMGLMVGVGCGSDEEKQTPLSSSDISIDELLDSLGDEWEEASYEGAEITTNGFINNGDIKTGTINNAQTACWDNYEEGISYCHTVLWEFKLSKEITVDIIVDGAMDITFYVLRYRNGSFTAIRDPGEYEDDGPIYENDEDQESSLSDYTDTSTFSQLLEKGTYFIAIGSFEEEDSYRLATVWY